MKSRTQTYTPLLFDCIQGNNKYLIPSETNTQATINTSTGGFEFESTGFQVMATGGSAINRSGQGADNMVSYSWKVLVELQLPTMLQPLVR